MMLVVSGDRAIEITVINEGNGCNVEGALRGAQNVVCIHVAWDLAIKIY